MSQLRKSASFRSRIPVKRRIPKRRCSSPQPNFTNLKGLQSNRSFPYQGGHRHYSSSSYSSNDESSDSEVSMQKFHQRQPQQTNRTPIYRSNDTISLDDVLDSISTGSFSSPPSPVQYQNTKMPSSRSSSYESLDKYNTALETFKLTETTQNIPYQLIQPSAIYKNIDDVNKKLETTRMSNSKMPQVDVSRDEAKKSHYVEKQRNLSDWYYIKNSPKTNDINKPINNHQYQIEQSQISSHRKASSISSLSTPIATTLSTTSTTTTTTTPTPEISSQPLLSSIKSTTNNFDNRNGLIPTKLSPGENIQRNNKFQNNIKNKIANFNIETGGAREVNVTSAHSNGDCQPFYQHNYNRQNNYFHNHNNEYRSQSRPHHHHQNHQNHQNYQNDQENEDNSNETEKDFTMMPTDNIGVNNVNSLRQQMQIQCKQQKNNNSCNYDANCLSFQYNTKLNANGSSIQMGGTETTDHFENGNIKHQQQQQQQQQQIIANMNNKTLDDQNETEIYDDKDLQTTSNQYNNGPNAVYQRQNYQQLTQKHLQHHKHQDNFRHQDVQPQQFHQLQQHQQHQQPQEQQQSQQIQQQQSQPLIRSPKQGQNRIKSSSSSVITNYKGSQNRLDNIRALGISTSVPPPIKAKVIQKRSDETSCSSFEHLNILGIPTATSTAAEATKQHNKELSNLNEIIGGYEGQVSQMTRALYENIDVEHKLAEAKRRPLPQIPIENEIFPPKTTSCRSECELSGSYASLECPSPPGPPICLPESRRDPQARLSTYLRTFYTDLALKEPIIPPWAIPVAPGALSPSRLEPEIRLHSQSHGFNDCITVDQILISLQTKEGAFLEAPRRVLIECPSWTSRSNLCLRILHAWAKEPPWPSKGTPVALALFIPLNELKRGFASYVEKELLPKGPLNPFASGFGGFTAAWNSLESLGPKLLIVLDGYDNQRGSPKRKGKHYPPDVHDLLDGKLFSEARVIITTSTTNNIELMPLIQRHITYEGLTWGRSASLLGGGQWGGPSRLLDTVQESVHLRKVVRTPLGCLAIAAIYDANAGDLPTDELDVVESVLNCVAPETSPSNVAELGRLALFCLKMKRPCITIAEIRMYCSSPESSILGCLDKSLLLGKSAKKKAEFFYNPMCAGMAEFLAANYISSLANRPGLLAAEITGLSIGDELDPDLLKVIKFSMGLLGTRAHVLLSKLTPLWLTPQIVFSLALAGGCSEDNLAALCDILGISKHPPISPLEAKPLWVQVRSVPTDLLGWGMALKSPTCTLKNLEVIYQLEKHSIMESRNAIEVFLDSLALNESVSTLRLCSLIETEVKDSEITYLANCVSKVLIKPRLENFELVLTLLEEDPPILKLQPVVSALCRSIPHQTKLSFLLLDLGLSTSQLVQLCATLEKCPNVTRLSLPHLRCEKGAISALASLLNSRPMSFLSLPSCWGARDDPPSSSGVSMGSGSGSSTGTSGYLIKQGSLPGVPSPRSYPPGLFSSLPRGIFVPTTTLGRSATLPRQPMEPSIDKRSCDSVVSKTWYPTPACDGGPHNSGTLHDLLLAAREPYSKLHGLDLSKAQLSLEDSMCLGETVRVSNTLHTLKLEGSSRLSEILPSVLGASESPCLQMLSIGSPRLSLEDSAIAMCARALTSCSTLRLLSLDGWGFRIENPATLSILRAFLSLTSIRELSLANARLQISLIRSDTKILQAFESRSVVVLKLSGAQAILADSTILRGPQLLPYVGGFPCLRELDLSAPARSGLGTTHSSPLILDDKCVISFFQNLHTHFSLLNTLKICNWVIHFDDLNRTLKSISKCIRNSPISHIKLDGISVLDRPKKQRIESQLIHCFISSLPLLRWMGISLSGKKEDQITAIGNAVLDLKGYEIDIKLSESTIEHAKLMAQAISLDGKFDIKVSTFGTSSGILIHAEKSGTKSLTRKSKD